MRLAVANPVEVDTDPGAVAIDVPQPFEPANIEQASSCSLDGSLMDTKELGDKRRRAGADRTVVVPSQPEATKRVPEQRCGDSRRHAGGNILDHVARNRHHSFADIRTVIDSADNRIEAGGFGGELAGGGSKLDASALDAGEPQAIDTPESGTCVATADTTDD
jgi:hypothetical protein